MNWQKPLESNYLSSTRISGVKTNTKITLVHTHAIIYTYAITKTYLASISAFSRTAWAICSVSKYFFLPLAKSFTVSCNSAWIRVSWSTYCKKRSGNKTWALLACKYHCHHFPALHYIRCCTRLSPSQPWSIICAFLFKPISTSNHVPLFQLLFNYSNSMRTHKLNIKVLKAFDEIMGWNDWNTMGKNPKAIQQRWDEKHSLLSSLISIMKYKA